MKTKFNINDQVYFWTFGNERCLIFTLHYGKIYNIQLTHAYIAYDINVFSRDGSITSHTRTESSIFANKELAFAFLECTVESNLKDAKQFYNNKGK